MIKNILVSSIFHGLVLGDEGKHHLVDCVFSSLKLKRA